MKSRRSNAAGSATGPKKDASANPLNDEPTDRITIGPLRVVAAAPPDEMVRASKSSRDLFVPANIASMEFVGMKLVGHDLSPSPFNPTALNPPVPNAKPRLT